MRVPNETNNTLTVMTDTDSENTIAAREAAKAALWKPLTLVVAAFGVVNIAVLLVLWPYLADKAEKRAAVEAHAAAMKATENYVSQRLAAFDQIKKQASAETEGLRKTFGELQHTLGRLDEGIKFYQMQMKDGAASQETALKAARDLVAAVEAEYRKMDRTGMAGQMKALTARTDELEQQFAVLEKGVPEQQLREIAAKLRSGKDAPVPAQPGTVRP